MKVDPIYHLSKEICICGFIELSVIKMFLFLKDVCFLAHNDSGTALVFWFNDNFIILFQRPDGFVFLFNEVFFLG